MGRNHFPCLNRICQLSVLAILFAWAATYSTPAHAQTYEVIHNFGNGTDGAVPNGAIYTDSAGNIYGATSGGGTSGAGVIYQIDQNGKETILHSFDPSHSIFPTPGLSFFNGTWLFGVTQSGGGSQQGSIFAQQLSPPAFKVVHSFGGPDGSDPVGTLVLALDGSTAYRVTSSGGAYNQGEVYKIDKSGDVTVIYSFTGGLDGATPAAGLWLDSQANLYGVTAGGGPQDRGVFFRIAPTGEETVLHNFEAITGTLPYSTPVADGMGNVYGTTKTGGGQNGAGVIYRLNLATTNYTVVHTFSSRQTSLGETPIGNLVKDGSGHVYGVTFSGGSSSCECGLVYQMMAAGSYAVLHTFGGNDGANPNWLYRDPTTGVLYGTTVSGGTYGQGVLFRITP
jgi:uncharacterized repeat protein (TIGR03803 family)